MAYDPIVWEDRIVSNPMTFFVEENGDGTVTLISAEGTVIQEGTPINADNLNYIENGILNSVALSDYVNHAGYGRTTNIGNNYSISLNPAPSSYYDGMLLSVKINASSTGASTINVNGLGAKPITTSIGDPFSDLIAEGIYTMRYNSTTGNFILQGEGGVSGQILLNFINDTNSILGM